MSHPTPQFFEGERAVLGALILDNEACSRVQGILDTRDFYDPTHQAIYAAMTNLREEGQPIDLVTLSGIMQGLGPKVLSLLVSLVDSVPDAENVLHYARHIKDRSIKRRLIAAAQDLPGHADKSANELLSEFEGVLTDLRRESVAINEDSLWRIRRDTESLLDLEAKILAKEVVEECLPSGLLDVDYYTGGFFPGNVVVICGCSGMGKTALALDISWHMAKENHPVLYCSFEMTRKEVARRVIAKQCKVNILDLKRHSLNEFVLRNVQEKMAKFAHVPYLVDERNLTPTEIAGQLTRLNNQHPENPIEVIAVDHIQLMGVRDTTQYQRRDLQLGAYMSQLKDIAKQFNLVVLVLSQLNRRVAEKGRATNLPTRADIRDSGAIEENADIIIGIHRQYEITKDPEDSHRADAVLIKNRDGMTGKIKLLWKPEWATFTNLDRSNRPEPIEPVKKVEEPEPIRVLETQEGTYDLF